MPQTTKKNVKEQREKKEEKKKRKTSHPPNHHHAAPPPAPYQWLWQFPGTYFAASIFCTIFISGQYSMLWARFSGVPQLTECRVAPDPPVW